MTMNIEERLAALEAKLKAGEASGDDTVPASTVWELIDAVKQMFGQNTATRAEIFHEVGELAKFINDARKQLAAVRDDHITDKELPDAESQLDAIVRMTEEATGKIMDSCDQITMFHNDLKDRLINMDPPLDPDALAGMEDTMTQAATSVTQVYEACNFQDITGQRIQKVVKLLQEIERKVLRMVLVFGMVEKEDKLDDTTRAEFNEDAALLNGPSMPGQGLEQDDIDAILAKLL
ncbi:MAG: protein phosphatase CheZ [Pseudomonadaceae bacterium]|nr:protein phosphatase CheZ [Pseudomonadaceae bacterium]